MGSPGAGGQLAEFPLEPMSAKFLLASGDAGCSEEALTVDPPAPSPHALDPSAEMPPPQPPPLHAS